MQLIRGLHNLRVAPDGCVLTIGNFDGVHLGHRALLDTAIAAAAERGVPTALLTFEPTPREFFSPASAPPRVYTLRDKLAALSEAGLGRAVVGRFDRHLAGLSADGFIDELLIRRLNVRAVVVGDDFRFGANRCGDFDLLARRGRGAGFSVLPCGPVHVQGLRCSSTRVREQLAMPDFGAVAALLGRPYTIRGIVRGGLQLGRRLGMPTANLHFRRPMALRHGVYAVSTRVGLDEWLGVASLGVRPTLGMSQCLLETHVFGEPGSLYGKEMVVEFRAFLRPQLKFDSLDALSEQMRADADLAKAILRGDAGAALQSRLAAPHWPCPHPPHTVDRAGR